MALTVNTLRKQEEAKMAMYTVDRRLWHTADKARVVEDGDAEAAFLFASPGTEVPMEEAKALGIVRSEKKSAEKPADKSVKPPADK